VNRVVVATLNVWNKSGPWLERRELVRAELERRSPDLCGLQEILRLPDPGNLGDQPLPPEADQAADLAEGLGYRIAFAPAAEYGSGLQFGNALLSRWPIREQRTFSLPGRESGETRALLYCLVASPYGDVPVFVTHLNWKLHHGSFRVAQVQYIVERMFELAPTRADLFPAILMGDFNAEPDSDEIRFLVGKKTLAAKSAYFADAWTYAGDGSPGYTFDRKNRFAALAHEPPRRIDYIFVRGPDRWFRGEPLATELAFATPVAGSAGDVWPSDHFGLATELAADKRREY
jgi:endonuclease/exonuclease/phosphatase family metal-dependent hydrolase